MSWAAAEHVPVSYMVFVKRKERVNIRAVCYGMACNFNNRLRGTQDDIPVYYVAGSLE